LNRSISPSSRVFRVTRTIFSSIICLPESEEGLEEIGRHVELADLLGVLRQLAERHRDHRPGIAAARGERHQGPPVHGADVLERGLERVGAAVGVLPLVLDPGLDKRLALLLDRDLGRHLGLADLAGASPRRRSRWPARSP
jgi:hypothetical protein